MSGDGFAASRQAFEGLLSFLDGAEAAALSASQMEDQLSHRGRDLLLRMMQDHLDARGSREQRLDDVVDADGATHGAVETGHTRGLHTIFGEVDVTRMAYRARGRANLYPADAVLNLPAEKHSHGLRRLVAVEAARGSFDDTLSAVERATGQKLGKRQVENLAARAAVDFDAFYARERDQQRGVDKHVLVISCDGKGVVMRPGALREATARKATSAKLKTRLSKGEKANRKRMAEVGAVYDVRPVPRTVADILPDPADPEHVKPQPPTAVNKWLTASVVNDAATVVGQIFDEADRRDPGHARTWIALVDGNNHQIDRVNAEARRRSLAVTILIDFIHVIEYVSAPRGARLYPPLSGERLEGVSLGLMAYLALKGQPGTAACQLTGGRAQAYGAACRGTRGTWRKLDCLNPNVQKVQVEHPSERRLKPAPLPAPGSICAWRNLRNADDAQ